MSDSSEAPEKPEMHAIERSETREVVAMVWRGGQEIDLDHGPETHARVVVVEGNVVDEAFVRTRTGFRIVRRDLRAGDAVEIPAGSHHRFACEGPAITVHELRPITRS